VSGALFEVTEHSPQKQDGEHTYYFCCGSCLAYFDKHAADVRAKRGYPG
jgi:YHS domain-containing protein